MKALKTVRIIIWSVCLIVGAYTLYGYVKVKNMKSDEANMGTRLDVARADTALNSADGMSTAQIDAPKITPVAGIKPSAPFSLVDHKGQPFTQDSAAWKGKTRLIYFGFASCPAICPAELHKMTVALNALPPEKSAQIQPIFITIDPERDTVAAMNDYVSLFHPRFIGVTGAPDNIKAMLKDWNVFATRVDDESLNGYTMDHSSYIYLQQPDNSVLALFRMRDSAQSITDFLNKSL